MFRYSLNELLNDKELCKKVITKKLYLYDGGGEFKSLDFENNSMRYNHITAFEQLYKIGGKKLFDAILNDGKTCLSDNPDAAKVGVVAIKGADGYYLKSNVSAIVAFMSILNGLKHMGVVSELFDMDDIYVEYEDIREEILADVSEEDMEYMEKLDRIHSGEQQEQSEAEEFDQMASVDEPDAYEQKLEVCKSDDGYFLCDTETGERVSFECNNGTQIETVSLMYNVQHISYKEKVGTSYNNGVEDDITEERFCGYRYQLEKDGKRGFISEHFAYFVYPIYEDICVTEKGDILGYYFSGDSVIDISVAYSAEYTDENNFSEYEKVLHDAQYKYVCNDKSKSLYLFRNLPIEFIPDSETDVSYCYDGFSPEGIAITKNVLFSELLNKGVYRCISENNFGFENIEQYFTQCNNGILTMELTGSFNQKKMQIPASGVFAKFCKNACHRETNDGIEYIQKVGGNTYIARREGYYALVEYDYDCNKISDYLTPFAFTKIQPVMKHHCIVERFGKKGVYNYNTNNYVIPCEYETIHYDGSSHFIVYKSFFKGEISCDGKWSKHLHRED